MGGWVGGVGGKGQRLSEGSCLAGWLGEWRLGGRGHSQFGGGGVLGSVIGVSERVKE